MPKKFEEIFNAEILKKLDVDLDKEIKKIKEIIKKENDKKINKFKWR